MGTLLPMLAVITTALLTLVNLIMFLHGHTDAFGTQHAEPNGWLVIEDWHGGLRETKWEAAIDATGNGNDEFQFYALSGPPQ